MRAKCLRSAMAAILLLLLSSPNVARGGSVPERTPPDSVEFTISSDPRKVVLFVAQFSPQSGVNRSMTLHGDGRLSLAELGSNREVRREHKLELSAQQLHDLVSIAVDHRLPEYDESEIRARQLRGKTKSGSEGVLDGPTTIVAVSLESYSRDGFVRKELRTEIQVYALKYAARAFPDVVEYQGLLELQSQLYRFWEKAGWALW